jgi:hypothetical protein
MRKKLIELFGFGKKSPTISSVDPNIAKTRFEKTVRDIEKITNFTKGQTKKKMQDFDAEINRVKARMGQGMQKLKGEKVTESGISKGKDLKKVEKRAKGGRAGYKLGSLKPGVYNKLKELMDESKAKKQDKARVKKMGGGMMGRRFGMKVGTPNPRKTNVQKINEAFATKKKVPNKFKGFSKLPEKVQQKIDAKLAKKV